MVLGATPDQLGIKWCLESTIHHGKNWIVPTFLVWKWSTSDLCWGDPYQLVFVCQVDYNVPIDMANNKPISHGVCRSSREQTKLICLHHCWIYLSQVQPVFVQWLNPVVFPEFRDGTLDCLVAGILHELLLKINRWFAGRHVILVGKNQWLRQTFPCGVFLKISHKHWFHNRKWSVLNNFRVPLL